MSDPNEIKRESPRNPLLYPASKNGINCNLLIYNSHDGRKSSK